MINFRYLNNNNCLKSLLNSNIVSNTSRRSISSYSNQNLLKNENYHIKSNNNSFLINREYSLIEKSYYSTQTHHQATSINNSGKHHHHHEKSCWKCKKSVLAKEFFCPLCNVVQTPHERFNIFEVFSLEPSYRVDQKDLSHRFKLLQKKLHPDLFQQSTETEQNLSKDQSTLINSAYNILKSPFLRAEFILNDKGYDLNGVTDVDPEVLSEILEVREEIEDTDSEEKLKEIAHDNRAKMNHCEEELVNIFKNNNYKEAVEKTIYLRYLTRIQEELHKRLGVHI